MNCKNCGKNIDEGKLSIRNSVMVYIHLNGEYFCNKKNLPKYCHAEPNKTNEH